MSNIAAIKAAPGLSILAMVMACIFFWPMALHAKSSCGEWGCYACCFENCEALSLKFEDIGVKNLAQAIRSCQRGCGTILAGASMSDKPSKKAGKDLNESCADKSIPYAEYCLGAESLWASNCNQKKVTAEVPKPVDKPPKPDVASPAQTSPQPLNANPRRSDAPAVPDAYSCVQLGTAKGSQTMKNGCAAPIVVFWCHDSNLPGTQDGSCGRGAEFYPLKIVIKPGQEEGNSHTQPLGANLIYGACYGDYSAYKLTDDKGGYQCLPSNAALRRETTLNTARGATDAQACRNAQALASSKGGTCACESRGGTSICSVQTEAIQQDGSATGWAAKKLHLYRLENCRQDPDCKPKPGSAIGRRG